MYSIFIYNFGKKNSRAQTFKFHNPHWQGFYGKGCGYIENLWYLEESMRNT